MPLALLAWAANEGRFAAGAGAPLSVLRSPRAAWLTTVAAVGELIGEGQLIVNWEAYPEDVAQFLHAHPTQNEALGEAAMALFGHPLHS